MNSRAIRNLPIEKLGLNISKRIQIELLTHVNRLRRERNLPPLFECYQCEPLLKKHCKSLIMSNEAKQEFQQNCCGNSFCVNYSEGAVTKNKKNMIQRCIEILNDATEEALAQLLDFKFTHAAFAVDTKDNLTTVAFMLHKKTVAINIARQIPHIYIKGQMLDPQRYAVICIELDFGADNIKKVWANQIEESQYHFQFEDKESAMTGCVQQVRIYVVESSANQIAYGIVVNSSNAYEGDRLLLADCMQISTNCYESNVQLDNEELLSQKEKPVDELKKNGGLALTFEVSENRSSQNKINQVIARLQQNQIQKQLKIEKKKAQNEKYKKISEQKKVSQVKIQSNLTPTSFRQNQTQIQGSNLNIIQEVNSSNEKSNQTQKFQQDLQENTPENECKQSTQQVQMGFNQVSQQITNQPLGQLGSQMEIPSNTFQSNTNDNIYTQQFVQRPFTFSQEQKEVMKQENSYNDTFSNQSFLNPKLLNINTQNQPQQTQVESTFNQGIFDTKFQFNPETQLFQNQMPQEKTPQLILNNFNQQFDFSNSQEKLESNQLNNFNSLNQNQQAGDQFQTQIKTQNQYANDFLKTPINQIQMQNNIVTQSYNANLNQDFLSFSKSDQLEQ